MIRARVDGAEIELTYEQFIGAVQEGRIRAETPVWSEILTSGVWKQAGQLQFFRSWAPRDAAAPPQGPEAPWPSPDDPAPGPARRESAPVEAGLDDRHGPEPPLDPIPWEQMDSIGFGAAWWRTIAIAVRDPAGMFRRIGVSTGLLPALVFGLLMTTLGTLAQSAYDLGMMRLLAPVIQEMEHRLPPSLLEGMRANPGDLLRERGIFVLLYPVAAFVIAGIIHLLLRGFSRPQGGFAATFRLANYVSALDLLLLLPLCGSPIAFVWELVLLIRGLSAVHRIPIGPAAAATLIPILIPTCLGSLALLGELLTGVAGLGLRP